MIDAEMKINTSRKLSDVEFTTGEAVGAAFDEALSTNPTSLLLDAGELSYLDRDTKLNAITGEESPIPRVSKQDALSRINDEGLGGRLEIGDEGITDEALSFLIGRKKEEIKRQTILEKAPSGFWSGTAQLGAGLAASVVDPLNIASAFIPVVGQAKYASMLANAGSKAGRAGVRLKTGALSGAAGSVAVEPIALGAASYVQADYGLYDSLLNVTFGTVLGGGLHAGAGFIGDVISKSDIKAKEDMLKNATAQLLDEGDVDVSRVAGNSTSFRESFSELELDKILNGVDVDPELRARVTEQVDNIKKEVSAKAREEGNEALAAKIESGKNTKEVLEEVATRVDDVSFKPNAVNTPDFNIKGGVNKGSDIDLDTSELSKDVSTRLADTDKDIDELFTALEEEGIYSPEQLSTLRSDMTKSNEADSNEIDGIKEVLLCAIGR